jgi:hypothetical protein
MKRSVSAVVLGAWTLAALLAAPTAWAQTPSKAPPGTGTDLEIDPDAKPEPPPPAELPPPGPDAWGVGGAEEEGRFAPKGKTGALKEQEEEAKEEEVAKGPLDLGPAGEVSVDTVIGFGDIRVVGPNDLSSTGVTVLSFVTGVSYRFGDTWRIGLRLPFSTGSSTGPLAGDADDYTTWAMGNLELAVRPTFRISRRLSIPVSFAFLIPMASGDLFADVTSDRGSIGQAVLNQAAAATRGWEENALFASKRVGLVPAAGVAYDRDALHLGASTKLDMMVKASGNDPKPAQGVLQDPNTTWVTTLSGKYDLLGGKVSPGVRTWLAVATVPARWGTSREYSGAQVALEPGVSTRLPLNAAKSLWAAGTLGYVLPLGGHLGGADDASVSGLRLRASFLF